MVLHNFARFAAVLFGLACIGLVFRSIIVNAFLTQLRRDVVSRSAWGLSEGVFRLFISKQSPQPRIDRAMAWFWPVVQFVMIYLWYLLVIAGFAAINWGVDASPTLRQAVVASGSAASTLGFSTPSNLQGEIVAIIEGGIGLFLVVFLLTFIPGYLTAQQSRSDQTSRVYARAGSPPPTGAALVEWYYRSGKGGDLDDSCATWETWVRDFGLAHSQSPALGLTRAHRSSQYWVSAVTAMMDAAAIARDVLDVPEASAPFFLAAAEHSLRDVARVLRASPLPVPPPSRPAFESMCERLRDAGAPVKANRQAAWQAFSQTQAAYAELLAGLADRARVGPALWKLSGGTKRERRTDARAALADGEAPRASTGRNHMEIQAAVFRRAHEPLAIESVDVDKPWGRELLVRTSATGVCHSDLHVVEGESRYSLDRPIVLGHEGAGVVEAVGDQVTTVRPGDHVVACLSGFCGSCAQCLGGHPNLCVGGVISRSESAPARLSQQGRPLWPFANIGSYAERMLLHENSVVKIDDDLPLDRAALVGCGVLTGVGAALRTSGLEAGQTVAVFGCGGVGLSIVQGARIGGARQIIAVDVFESKLETARRVGATHVVNSAHDDPVKAVRALTGGAGVDHAFEAVGSSKLVRQVIESLAIRGTATIVGVLPPDAMIEFPWLAIRPECRVQTSRMGSNRFRIDIPRYLDFYRQGRLMLDEMVTRRGRLDDINDAFRAMKAGEVARTVLTFD